MGADGPPGRATSTSATCVNVDVKAVEQAERIFAALAEGGEVQMALQETFRARRWGALTDRWQAVDGELHVAAAGLIGSRAVKDPCPRGRADPLRGVRPLAPRRPSRFRACVFIPP